MLGVQESDSSVPSVTWTLREQDQSIMTWMSGDEAREWCARCARRYGLPPDMTGEVLSATWIRLRRSLDRRDRAFDVMSSTESAARYAARACENTAIDFGRLARRSAESVALIDEFAEGRNGLDALPLAESRITLEELRRVMVRLAREDAPCGGCPNDVVLACALWIVNAQILGDTGPISDLLYDSLIAVDPTFPSDRGDAARQRKSRCGRCVVSLLRRAIESMEDRG